MGSHQLSIDRLPIDRLRVGDSFAARGLLVATISGALAMISEDIRHPDGLLIPLATQRGPGRINDVVRGPTCPECATFSPHGIIHASCQGAPSITPKEIAVMSGSELQENYGEVVFGPWPSHLSGVEITVLDFETTGFRPEDGARPIELAVVKISEAGILDSDSWLINPECPIPASSTAIHGIVDEMVKDSPTFDTVMDYFLEFLGDCTILSGHNIIKFDSQFLRFGFAEYGIVKPPVKMIDTLGLARARWDRGRTAGKVANHKLGTLAAHIGFEQEEAHRALGDTLDTARLLNHLLVLLAQEEVAESA